MIIVIAGVAGSGKTTVGRLLAARTGWTFLDADDYHAAASKTKMAAGLPLTDADRRQWLETLHGVLAAVCRRGEHLILACSALTETYRSLLVKDIRNPYLVWLEGDPALLAGRIASRAGHFFPAPLLDSQLSLAERPSEARVFDVAASPEAIVAAILSDLESRGHSLPC